MVVFRVVSPEPGTASAKKQKLPFGKSLQALLYHLADQNSAKTLPGGAHIPIWRPGARGS